MTTKIKELNQLGQSIWYDNIERKLLEDGTLQGMLNGSRTVPACYTVKGQEWYCELRPSDGTDFGQWFNLQNNITINNTPPSARDLAIIPMNPNTEDVLIATYYYNDNDTDPECDVNIIWFKDGVLQENLTDSLFVGSNYTVKGRT